MPNYSVDFGSDIAGLLESGRFSQSFAKNKDYTEKVLKQYADSRDALLLAIEGSQFTSNIQTIDTTSHIFDSYAKLLEAGTDGLILTGLNDISNDTLGGKSKIGVTLGVADCASIIGATKDGGTMFNVHAGYKGVFGNGKGGMVGGILGNLKDLIERNNMKISDFSEIHISPMAGSDYELPLDYIFEISNDFFQTFGITDFSKYFSNKVHLNKKNILCKNMDLRQIIIDVLIMFGFKKNQISDSGINTTDESNDWSSYRLFSNGKQKINSRLTSTITKKVS